MYRHIGKRVYTNGRYKWTRMKWGTIVGVGNPRYFIVKYDYGRKTWIRKSEVIFWN